MNKHLIFYSIAIFIILFLVCILFFLYDRYIYVERSNDQLLENKIKESQNSNIKRINYLLFSHKHPQIENESVSLFVIETIKVDNCKYIMISKKGQSPSIIHANDCEFCLKHK